MKCWIVAMKNEDKCDIQLFKQFVGHCLQSAESWTVKSVTDVIGYHERLVAAAVKANTEVTAEGQGGCQATVDWLVLRSRFIAVARTLLALTLLISDCYTLNS